MDETGAPDFLRKSSIAVRSCSFVGSVTFAVGAVVDGDCDVLQLAMRTLASIMRSKDRFCMEVKLYALS